MTSSLIYVKKSSIHGRGVFAATRLRKGQMIGKIEGRHTTRDGAHVLWIDEKSGIEVTNEFRFVNHSDTPNVLLYADEVVALCTIRADEELTHDYNG